MNPKYSTALVIAAPVDGSEPHFTRLPEADIVVAADSGVDVARKLGRKVDILVGDLDSATDAGIAWAKSSGARVKSYPTRKDFTDLELALQVAVDHAESVFVIASAEGRLDHTLGNLTVLASQRWANATVSANVGVAHVDVVRGRRRISGNIGDLVSLVAVGGSARSVRTKGLEYPLEGEDLHPCEARGISNVICSVPAEVEVASGVLLVIKPG